MINTIPQILLIALIAGLLVLTVSICVRFTKGPLSTAALKRRLLQLQSRFVASEPIDPELERQEMERLQNKIKTSSDQLTISGDDDLKQLIASNRNYIQLALAKKEVANKTSWIQFNALMTDFDHSYFTK